MKDEIQTLEIIELGHPVLRDRAIPVSDPTAPEIQTLIDRLILTMQQSNGVGIAAPQVAESLQIMIVASRPNLRYPTAPMMEPLAMINPKLVSHSSEVVKGWEGCLSIPGIRGQVPRPQAIEIEYDDRSGKTQRMEMTDFVARIFQHELDHLNGVVFIDRVESVTDLMTEKEFMRQVL